MYKKSEEVNEVNGWNNKAYTNDVDTKNPDKVINGNVSKDDKEKDETKKEEKQLLGVTELFRYADKLDMFLMALGTLLAGANGAALPCLMIVFGEMTDMFIDSSQFDNATLTAIYDCGLEAHGTTLNEIMQDVNLLQQYLLDCNRTDIITDLTENMNKGLLSEMSGFAIYYFIIGAVVLVSGYGQVTFWLIASLRQTQRIRTACFRKIMRMEVGWFDTNEVGMLNTRLSDDINKIADGIGDKIGNFFQWFLTFVAGIVIGFAYGWKLALVIMACSPLLVGCGGFMTWVMSAFTKNELKAYAKAGSIAEEVFGAIRTVMAFGGQEKESKRYGVNLEDAKTYGIRKAVVSGGGMGVVFMIIFASYALAFWYGSSLVRSGEYTAGKMLIVFFAVMFGAFGLGNAAPNLQNFAAARGAAFAIFEILDRDSQIDSASTEGEQPETLKGNITFNNVYFNYPSRPEVPILQGLDIKVDVGQTVALVGSSGCGKSTTVQLLQRFYDTSKGSIMLDGKDIRSLNIKWLRQHIGMVSQEPILFATTIKENIMFGKEGVTEADVIKAAQEANAHDFISKLPKKYETLVGERGAQLSGGQKQRIAIARALIRDPRILLLDEATSALDTESEAIVQEALDKARTGRTTLVIAHRLSTIKTADHIYSLADGKIFEEGTHDELMEAGESGIYYHLVMNQKSLEEEGQFEEIGLKTSEIVMEREIAHGKRASLKRGLSRNVSVAPSTTDEDVPEVSMTRLIRLNAPEWPYILLGCIAALANGAIMPAFAVVFAEIIGVFAKPPEEQKKEANLFSAMFLVIGIIAAIAMFTQALMFGVSGEKLTKRLRSMVFKSYMKQEMAFFDDHLNSVGALCTRLATDASAVQGATGVRLGTVFQSLASLGTGIVIGFIFSWKLALLVVAFLPLIVIAGALQMKILGGSQQQFKGAYEEAGKVTIESIENIRVVASLTKEESFAAEYERLTSLPYKVSLKKSHIIGLSFSLSQSLIFFCYAACFYLGAYLIENDGLYFEDMFKVFAAVIFGAMAIGQASAFAPDYTKAKVSAGRVFQLLDSEPSIDSSSTEGIKLGAIKGSVKFRSVQFSYPSRSTVKVLKGIDIDVQPGLKIALVGSSGCGKSTVISLLERFYDPSEGSVNLDGHEIRDINLQSLRSKLGIVQQEPILFNTSIRENVAYGDNSREVTMPEIIQAARDANIHNFIESLPEGYDTNVGEKGTQLSGGQKQRVAIARALVRNPKILLLDEATSALDTESEKVVQEALEKAQEGRTSIVIAHRLSTIQNSDTIMVIDQGEVAEQGTHAELISHKGLYYNLHLAQQKKKS